MALCGGRVLVGAQALALSTVARGASFIFVMSAAPVAAQAVASTGAFYGGGEGGWTSLASETGNLPGKRGPETWTGGFNVGARLGYEWEMLRLEGEFRYQENDVSSIARHSAKGDRAAYPLLVNLIYDIRLGWPVSPHFGAGIGAVALHDRVRVPVIGIGEATDRTDWEFGYQAIAGLRYDIGSNVAVDIDYRYLATTTPSFTIRPGLVIDGTSVGNLEARSGYHSHSLVASLIFRFGPVASALDVSTPSNPLQHRAGPLIGR